MGVFENISPPLWRVVGGKSGIISPPLQRVVGGKSRAFPPHRGGEIEKILGYFPPIVGGKKILGNRTLSKLDFLNKNRIPSAKYSKFFACGAILKHHFLF